MAAQCCVSSLFSERKHFEAFVFSSLKAADMSVVVVVGVARLCLGFLSGCLDVEL